MNASLNELEIEIQDIKSRNDRVSADKAWETSWIRKALIAACTYLVLWAYMTAIGVEPAYLHALVPTVGFLLSTLTLSVVKRLWIEKVYKK